MCDGIRFTTEHKAMNAITYRQVKGFNLEPYQCADCGGWHAREGKIGPVAGELHDLDRGQGECFRKRVFTSEKLARRAAATYGLRAYGCPHCGHWHLTSQVEH